VYIHNAIKNGKPEMRNQKLKGIGKGREAGCFTSQNQRFKSCINVRFIVTFYVSPKNTTMK
jgi:hypothetical protein